MANMKKAKHNVGDFWKKYKQYIIIALIAAVIVIGYQYLGVLEEKFPTIEWQETVFYILGGLGIFLYGIGLMGDSLKALAGNKLKIIIEKSTNTPIKGILVGIVITGLIQSSSGTTAPAVK